MDYFTDVYTTFLGLERVSCVAVYAGSESSRISSKTSKSVFWRWTKVLRVRTNMKVSNSWQNSNFWVNYPFKVKVYKLSNMDLNILYHYSTAMQFPSQTLPPLYSCMCTLAGYVNHTIILQCLREDYIGFETEKTQNWTCIQHFTMVYFHCKIHGCCSFSLP